MNLYSKFNIIFFLLTPDDIMRYHDIDVYKRQKQYGYAGIVAARPGIKMSEMYYLYKDILSCQSPGLVIVEIGSAFDLKKKNAPKQEKKTLKSIAKYPSGELGVWEDALATELNELFPAIDYHSRWKSLTPVSYTHLPSL